MTAARMPRPHEAQQLARLRALRVQRARERIAPAQAAVDQAAQAVRARHQKIADLRGTITLSREAVVTTLAPSLPRWSAVTGAHLERLIDQLERNEYELIQDDRALEAAQEQLQQARSELTRALAREDAVQGLARQVKRARLIEREQRAERELDDQARPRSAR
jgi:flagellar biosynthesis chaperone FliJ